MRAGCARMLHRKCRQTMYPSSNVSRLDVPDDKVPWVVEYPEYKPAAYTAAVVHGKPWADPHINDSTFKPRWNVLDGKVNRTSFPSDYTLNAEGYPLNPAGRTGIAGRGLLGRWGPNHAADPIVTRWKRDDSGNVVTDEHTGRRVLQLVAIQRRDTGEWAIPGGMVDPGETVSATLMREFMEEALNLLEKGDAERRALRDSIMGLFARGEEVYRGYVDDPRNTDNAWIETVAMNFHDEDSHAVGRLALQAGDDARNVRWMDVNSRISLYASHGEFVRETVSQRDAHW